MHTTGRGEIANEVIQGDLVESRVVLAHDAKPLGDRLSTMARSADRSRAGRGAITRRGKAQPMLGEESDDS